MVVLGRRVKKWKNEKELTLFYAMRQISFVARLGEAIDDAYALQLGFRGGPELGDDGLDVALWGGMGNLGVHVVDLPRGALIGIVPCALFSAEGVRFAAEPLILLAQVLDIPGGGLRFPLLALGGASRTADCGFGRGAVQRDAGGRYTRCVRNV